MVIQAFFTIFKSYFTIREKYKGKYDHKEYYDKYSDRITTAQKIKAVNYSGSRVSTRVFDLLFRYPYYTDGKISGGKKFILKREL